MTWPRLRGPEDLDRVFRALPSGYVTRALGSARFVLGPSGMQVIAIDDGTPEAPRDVHTLALFARATLAEHLAWVPFVHALLVTERPRPCPPATRVPPALVTRALLDSGPALPEADLNRLVTLVEEGVLDNLAALAPADAHPLSSR